MVNPLDAGGKRIVLFCLALEEVADGADLGNDVGRLAEMEGRRRHLLEVLVDVGVVVRTHDVENLVAQRESVIVESPGITLASILEEATRGCVQLKHQAFLPARPPIG